jgi:hypothetical protein
MEPQTVEPRTCMKVGLWVDHSVAKSVVNLVGESEVLMEFQLEHQTVAGWVQSKASKMVGKKVDSRADKTDELLDN